MIHLSAVPEVSLNLVPEILATVMAFGGGWLLINSPVQMPWDTPLPAGWIPSWYTPPGCERMRGTLAAAGKEPVQERWLQRVRSPVQDRLLTRVRNPVQKRAAAVKEPRAGTLAAAGEEPGAGTLAAAGKELTTEALRS